MANLCQVDNPESFAFGNARIIEAMKPHGVHQDVKNMLGEATKTLT